MVDRRRLLTPPRLSPSACSELALSNVEGAGLKGRGVLAARSKFNACA